VSLRARLLNTYLRRVEKRAIARAPDVDAIRKRFDRIARLTFHAPRATTRRWETLGNGPKILHVTPPGGREDRVVFYIHGGAFVFGSPRTHAALAASLAMRLRAVAVLPQYRLAPEAFCPAAFDDVLAAYLAVAERVGAHRIMVGGDSAGGALALLLLAHLCGGGGPRPGGTFAFSPVTDLSFSGASFAENADREAVLPANRAAELVAMYLADQPREDPRNSPLFADYPNAPPVWITAGDTEILRDDTLRMVSHLQAQGGDVEERIEHDLPHVWPIFHNTLPEARTTLDRLAEWIRRVQGWQAES
jgi:acetyl esterase/lipase